MATESALRRATETGLRTFGKFQLQKKLATGGMAEVWLARHSGIEGFSKSLVVKMILPHLADDPEFVQMFLNEAKIAARLNHPNIAQIYELGAENSTYFIAMEFVHGEDLGRTMRKAWSSGQWIAAPLSMRIVAQACEGLYYAHTKVDETGRPLKVVHRDISPQNILISFDGSVKLVDFGIAKAADQASMTKSGAIKGKFSYMSPEQAAGKPLDQRSDVFSIGLVLYELLTGVRPLKRDNELATLQAALECKMEAPSKVADVAPDMDELVMRALAKSPEDRYPDARSFQMALEEYLVSHGWVAGSVQLSELMRTLFSDRLAEEDRLGYANPEGPQEGSDSGVKKITESSPAAWSEGAGGDTVVRTGESTKSDAQNEVPLAAPANDVARRASQQTSVARPNEESPRAKSTSLPRQKPSGEGRAHTGSAAGAPRRPTISSPRQAARSRTRSKMSYADAPPDAEPEPSQPPMSPAPLGPTVDRRALRAEAQRRNRGFPLGLFLTLCFAGGAVAFFYFRPPGPGGLSLTIESVPKAKIYVRHHPSEKIAERSFVGETPFHGESAAHEKDTLILENDAYGLYYEEEIPLKVPHNTHRLVKRFEFGSLRLPRSAHRAVWGATIKERGRDVGIIHPDRPPLELTEGKHQLEINGPAMKKPVHMTVTIKPGAELVLNVPYYE